MKTILVFFVLIVAFGQAPGTVTVSSTIVASTNLLTCSFSSSAPADVALLCKQTPAGGGVDLIDTVVKLPAVGNAFTWQSNQGVSDAITGIFTRTATGVNWVVTANGTVRSGAF